jgi:hypothetical protein
MFGYKSGASNYFDFLPGPMDLRADLAPDGLDIESAKKTKGMLTNRSYITRQLITEIMLIKS